MTDRETLARLKPGSPEAVARGCECPIIDNHHGAGVVIKGEVMHWTSSQCPIHGDLFQPDEAPR